MISRFKDIYGFEKQFAILNYVMTYFINNYLKDKKKFLMEIASHLYATLLLALSLKLQYMLPYQSLIIVLHTNVFVYMN